MWNKDRSIILSRVATRVMMLLGLSLAVALPPLIFSGFFLGRALIAPESVVWLMPIYYCFCLPAFAALIMLDRLLAAVRRGEVFTTDNVRRLRVISWCCFAAAIVLLASSFASIVFFALAVMGAFFGAILRTVKNLFAAAVAIKTENDFTI